MTSSPQGLHPAKIITPAIRQRLQELLTKARRMTRATPCPHGQIDDLLCECVIVDPGNTVYIGALLQHLRRSDRPRGMTNERGPTGPWDLVIGHLKRLLSVGFGSRPDPLSPIRTALDACNWEQVLTLGPPALCREPQSVEILRHLAAACAALEHEQAELCYLQAAVALAPSDVETQRQLARALTRQGLFDEAAVAWKRLTELLPEDEECRQTIKILCEYEPPADAPGILAEDDERQIRSAVESGTASMEQFRQLIHHLSNSRKLDEAEHILNRATMLLGTTLQLQDWREHLTMVRGWTALDIAHDLCALRPDYSQLPERKLSESNRVDLQICGRRCERYPDDLRLQIQLGRLLHSNGNFSEAVKRLEPVATIDAHRAEALAELGRSWEKLRQGDKAMACYQEAIDLAQSQGDLKTARRALRNAARLAERNGDSQLARSCYSRLLEFPVVSDLDRTHHDLYQLMLDNLDRVCHNS